MASYTKLNSREIDEIIHQYKENKVLKIEAMTTGISNSNYKIELEDTEPVILKISNDKDLKSFIEEEKILFKLSSLGFPYSVIPLKNLITNKFYFQKDGMLGALYPCLNGKVLPISKKVCFQVGYSIGKLHNSTKDLNLEKFEIRNYQVIGHDLKNIAQFCENHNNSGESNFKNFIKAFVNQFPKALIEEILNIDFESRLIHGDLYFDNVLFNQENKVIGVLDFEQAGIGKKILDLGISISGTCLNSQGNLCLDLVKDFIQGYKSVSSITPIEEKYLYHFIHLGLFSIALWRIERFDIKSIDPSRKNSYEHLINKSINFNKEVSYEQFQSLCSK